MGGCPVLFFLVLCLIYLWELDKKRIFARNKI